LQTSLGLTRVRLGDAAVDAVTWRAVPDVVSRLVQRPGHDLVVTPNIAHVRLARTDGAYRRANHDAALSTPDGWPVQWAVQRLTGEPCDRVTGSDLLPVVCRLAAERAWRVGILGGGEDNARKAADALRSRCPGLAIPLVEPAPRSVLDDPALMTAMLERVRAANLDVLFVGLGAPRQETFAHTHLAALNASVTLCVGAAIDFAAGSVRRAPPALQRIGFEWAYRLALEPRRLFTRYAVAGATFAAVMGAEYWARLTKRGRVGFHD
jgi:N-acetylglucosaminyldiphosphoundecaprenol N-acetyl-beta-D-mannosaminyltransferase